MSRKITTLRLTRDSTPFPDRNATAVNTWWLRPDRRSSIAAPSDRSLGLPRIEPSITGEDGRRTVELFTAIYRSQREGAVVRFPVPVIDEGNHR